MRKKSNRMTIPTLPIRTKKIGGEWKTCSLTIKAVNNAARSSMNKLKKSFGLLFPAMRISLALTLLSACIFISASLFGFTQNEDAQALEYRILTAESLTMQFSVMIPQRDTKKIEELIQLITNRNSTILSTGIRRASGQLIFQSSDHEKFWQGYNAKASNFENTF